MDAISRLGLDMDTAGLLRGAQAADRVAQSMDRAEREAGQLEQKTKSVGRQMSIMGGLANNLAAQLGAAFSVWSLIRASDAWTSATNQLRLVTQSARELRDVTSEVYQLSQRTASRFEATSGLYASIQRAAGDAIGSQREVLRLTETIMKLTAAGGGPEGSRNAALFQLRQAMQGTVLQAQEYNSLVDGAPLLVQALADSLGVTRGVLRQMVLDQRVQISDLISGLQSYGDEADSIFGRVAFTMGDAFVRLQNAFQKLVGTNLGPIFAGLVEGISFVAEHLDLLVPLLTGVGVALALAFAPTVLAAFEAALVSLYGLIAAHPVFALVAAITAAGVAMYQFGDAVVVTQARVGDFADVLGESFERTEENMNRMVNVTMRDYVSGTLSILGDAALAVANDVNGVLSAIVTGVTQGHSRIAQSSRETTDQVSLDWVDVANKIIGGLRTIYDWAKMVFPQLGDFIVASIGRGQNAIVAAVEAAINASRRLLNLEPITVPGRVDISANEQRMSDRTAALNESIQRNFSTNWIGDAAARNAVRNAEQLASASEDAATATEDRAAAAAKGADADERALDAINRMIAGKRQQFDLDRRREELLRQNQALRAGGLDELETLERTMEIMRDAPEIYGVMTERAEQRARAEAQVQLTLERQNEELLRQAERARELERAPLENLTQGLEQASDNFWTNFVERGGDAFGDLGDDLERMLRRFQADLMRQVFEPMLRRIIDQITRTTNNAGTGSSGGSGGGIVGSIIDAIGSIFGGGTQSGASGQSGGFNFSSIMGVLGGLLGGGNSGGGKDTQGNSTGGSGGGIMQQIAYGYMGYQLANSLGINAEVKDPDDHTSEITSVVGGIIGAYFGNSAIGSFVGKIIGDVVSGEEHDWAYQHMNKTSLIGMTEGSHATDASRTAVQAIGNRIIEGTKLLEQMGASITKFVTNIQYASNEPGYLEFSTAPGVNIRAGKDNGDPNALASEGLKAILQSASFTNPLMEAVRQALTNFTPLGTPPENPVSPGGFLPGPLGGFLFAIRQRQAAEANNPTSTTGKTFDEIITILGKLDSVLAPVKEATSEWADALQYINDTFTELRASTADLNESGFSGIWDMAFEEAMSSLRTRFSDTIEDAITQIENPLELQFEALLKMQAARLADANAIGVDVARVMHLNELELKGFIEQAGGSAEAFAKLNEVFEELIAQAQAAGQSTAPLIQAYDQARAGVVNAFNDDIADRLANLSNPTLAALSNLLEAQEARLDQARAIGANIVAVERLNAAEQRAFFEGLTDEQKQALGAYLGMIEDFTGRIAIVLSQLGDELNARIDNMEEMRADLLQRADAMGTLRDNLADARQSLTDRYGAATPMAGVEALRERITGLRDAARGGNESALQAIAQVGEQLIQSSRGLYGSTTTFRGDYDLVQSILEEAQGLAGGRADQLQAEAETLVQQRDLLVEIRDILSQPDPALDTLQLRLDALDANNSAVATLLAQYLQLAAAEAGQSVDLGQLYANATAAASAPPLSAATNAAPTSSLAAQQAPSTAAARTQEATNDGTAEMLALLVDVTKGGDEDVVEEVRQMNRNMRNLIQLLSTAA